MLADLPILKPDYVIFYDLSRVAREEMDALWLLSEIKRHGAKLESTMERVDDSPQGLLLFVIMAGVNAFRSRGDGERSRVDWRARPRSRSATQSATPADYANSPANNKSSSKRSTTAASMKMS
jgi:DNA invertase Pin-like site-specific DNA recombinase